MNDSEGNSISSHLTAKQFLLKLFCRRFKLNVRRKIRLAILLSTTILGFVLVVYMLNITVYEDFDLDQGHTALIRNKDPTDPRNEWEWKPEIALEQAGIWANCTPIPFEMGSWGRIKRKFLIIIHNFIMATQIVSCDQNFITLTTHGDYRFLDNLVTIVQRWRAPISVALYIPYDDLHPTLHRLAYIRACTTPLIKNWISVHLYTEKKHTTYHEEEIWKLWTTWENINASTLCASVPTFDVQLPTSRNKHKVTYPVNLGRNIAREAARTKYIFASDLELYPSPNFVSQFFQMLNTKHDYFSSRSSPHVFVLPIFEIATNITLPVAKAELVELLKKKVAVPFHKYVCYICHLVPKYKEWLHTKPKYDEVMDVFHIAKRHFPFEVWEPIFVSTNDIPFYEERVTWEGLRDKMSQSYKLCILDYDFMILNNAFLLHKPGIKRQKHVQESHRTNMLIDHNNWLIYEIVRKVTENYGTRKECKA